MFRDIKEDADKLASAIKLSKEVQEAFVNKLTSLNTTDDVKKTILFLSGLRFLLEGAYGIHEISITIMNTATDSQIKNIKLKIYKVVAGLVEFCLSKSLKVPNMSSTIIKEVTDDVMGILENTIAPLLISKTEDPDGNNSGEEYLN